MAKLIPPPVHSSAVNLDAHQKDMVAFLQTRLGGTSDEVIEFLVTCGLYVLQLDELAEGRVRRGIKQLYGDSETSTSIMNDLVDIECNVKNEVLNFKARALRPRMCGDWRGETAPSPAEA